jgi:hypothetical protein
MWQHVELTNGTTTLVLTDNINYALVSYAPTVAPRRGTTLGGVGPIAEVDEPLIVDVLGSTPAVAQANLRDLNTILNGVLDWRDDDVGRSAVRIRVLPQCSSKTTLYEACLMMVAGEPMLTVPEYNATLGLYVIENVEIAIRRRGQWLNESDTASSAATSSGAIWSITLPSHDEYSPVDLSWTLPTTSNSASDSYNLPGAGMIAVDNASDIAVFDSASFTAPSAPFSTVAVTNALGGSVMRLTPAAANTFYFQSLGVPTILNTPGQYLIAGAIRLGSSSTPGATWTLYMLVQDLATGSLVQTQLPPIVIPLATTVRTITNMHVLGIVSVVGTQTLNTIRLAAAVDSLSTTPTLDLDYLIVARITPGLLVQKTSYHNVSDDFFGTSTAVRLKLEQRLTSALSPKLSVEKVAGGAPQLTPGYTGKIAPYQKGTTYTGVWVGGNDIGVGGNQGIYRAVQQPPAASGTLFSSVVTATRRRAYAIPE